MKVAVFFFATISLIFGENIESWKSFNNWVPEVAATGGGNNEFQQYYLHPEAAQLINGTLNLKPLFDTGDLREDLDLYPYGCNNNWNNGCYSKGSMHWNKGELHYENNKPIPVGGKRTKPFISTKLVSKKEFGYGNLTIEFKLPKGNFLWPAIWMLPSTNHPWPVGGEIDIMESMGNSPESGFGLNYKSVSSALHFGYNKSLFPIAYTSFAEKVQKVSYNRNNLNDDWQKISLYRNKYNIIVTLNGNEIFNCDKMFKAAAERLPKNTINREEIIKYGYLSGFRKYIEMMGETIPEFLWKDLPHDAPFHDKFKLIINLAIGGNFFGDSMNSDTNKVDLPWGDISSGTHPAVQFLKNIDNWYNWGDKSNKNNKDICTLSVYECIKDHTPCDKYKECYLEDEKHLAYDKPISNNESIFKIKNIYFEPYNN
jgi:hypothetical protein